MLFRSIIKQDDKVSGEDVREGLTAIISVKLTDAQFEGQTKAKLGNASIRTLVSNIVTQQLAEFLEENPAVARAILYLSLIHISNSMAVSYSRSAWSWFT